MKKECLNILKKLTNKKHIFFTDRGNTSIFLCLQMAKHLEKKKVYIQDQGGWLRYEKYIKKLGLELNYLETDYGVVKDFNVDEDSVLLINSMPGYYTLQENMNEVFEYCKSKGALLINDVSGSIGTEFAKYGDLILGSFGRWKPIELNYGGFIAFDNKEYKKFFSKNFNKELKDFFSELNEALTNLPNKLKKWKAISSKIKRQLKNFDIIPGNGINVIIKFSNADEELELIDYCKLYDYPFTMCPRYIRVLTDAISIEVKRLV